MKGGRSVKNIANLDVYRNNKVKQSNLITQAMCDLSLNGFKFLKLLASMISSGSPEIKTFYFRVKDIMVLFGLEKSGSAYVEIPKVTKELMSKVIVIPISKTKFRQYPLLSMAEHDAGTGVVGARISDELRPFFVNLKNDDTEYKLLYLVRLKSLYSIRTYEILKMYEDGKDADFELSYLKKLYEIETPAYNRIDNIRRRVLDVAKAELEDITDTVFEYSLIKKGRKCVGIKFTKTTKQAYETDIDQSQVEEFCQINEIINILQNQISGIEININSIKEMIDKQGFNNVKYYAENINDYLYDGVKNIQALFIDAVCKHGTSRQYTKPIKSLKESNIPQTNFEQREYDDKYYETWYTNKKD